LVDALPDAQDNPLVESPAGAPAGSPDDASPESLRDYPPDCLPDSPRESLWDCFPRCPSGRVLLAAAGWARAGAGGRKIRLD